jgi:hypothetical protein
MSEIDYNTINPANLNAEIYGEDPSPAKEVQTKAPVKEAVKEEAPETVDNTEPEDDTPWDDDETETADKKEPAETTDPEETEEDKAEQARLDALEASEAWRKKRLNKEIEHKRQVQEENAKLKAELDALRAEKGVKAPDNNQPAPASFDEYVTSVLNADKEIQALQSKVAEIKAKKDEMTEGDYVDALTDANTDLKTEIKFKKEMIRQSSANQQMDIQRQEAEIGNKYLEQIKGIKETYPKIDKAYNELEKVAGDLHVEIRKAILLDPNAAELTWKLGSSKRNLEFLIESSKVASKTGSLPVEAIKFIGRMATETKVADKAPEAPKAPAIPRVPKQASKAKDETEGDLNAWAEKAHKAGQRPW